MQWDLASYNMTLLRLLVSRCKCWVAISEKCSWSVRTTRADRVTRAARAPSNEDERAASHTTQKNQLVCVERHMRSLATFSQLPDESLDWRGVALGQLTHALAATDQDDWGVGCVFSNHSFFFSNQHTLSSSWEKVTRSLAQAMQERKQAKAAALWTGICGKNKKKTKTKGMLRSFVAL